MKKKYETRYIVTDIVNISVIRLISKTEAYKQAAKPGWVQWKRMTVTKCPFIVTIKTKRRYCPVMKKLRQFVHKE